MGTSIVFDLIDALNDRWTSALTGINVIDGTGMTDDPGDFLMVGVEDPDTDTYADSAESVQSWAGLGARHRDEEGTVTCCALSWNGDANQRAARQAVKATLAAVENDLRSDPNLGGVVPGLLWTGFGTRLNLSQIQSETGAAALGFFQIQFKARI